MRSSFMINTLFSFFLMLGYINPSMAQIAGSWSTVSFKGNFNAQWSAFGEIQLRSLSIYNRFYYYEIKAGINYSPQKKILVSLGSGQYNTFREGKDFEDYKKQNEIRVWEQFIYEQNISVLKLEHRLRIEQRFLNEYANRLRYRLNISIPLNKREIVKGAIYLSGYDEVFFSDDIPVFRRNRFFIGGGYRFIHNLSLQMGLLNQTDYSENNPRIKNYLFAGFSMSLGKQPERGASLIVE